jgi:hypothetical protein
MPEDAEEYSQEYDTEYEGDRESEDEADEQGDASFDILAATVEVDGEEITVEELKRGNLRHRDYTRKTQELAEARREMKQSYEEISVNVLNTLRCCLHCRSVCSNRLNRSPTGTLCTIQTPRWQRRQSASGESSKRSAQLNLQAVQAERQRMAQLEQQRMEQMQARYFEEQRRILPEIIPEWRDTLLSRLKRPKTFAHSS